MGVVSKRGVLLALSWQSNRHSFNKRGVAGFMLRFFLISSLSMKILGWTVCNLHLLHCTADINDLSMNKARMETPNSGFFFFFL